VRIEVRPASFTDVDPIASRMREADKREVWAAGLMRPDQALAESLRSSRRAWTGLLEDRPVAMFGCASMARLTGSGSAWLLGTDDLAIIPMRFAKESRRWVGTMLEVFNPLVNWVDARNTASISWLEWLGADISPAAPWGALGLPFHRFEVRHVR
jgi:hypothetical protein